MVLRLCAATLVLVCGVHCSVFAQPCWDTVVPQDVVGFDFEITSRVEGPAPAGIYTYTYVLYRIDNGYTRYREVSHVSFWFPCGVNAERSILGWEKGVSMTCTEGTCPVVEMGGSHGMTEPVMNSACKFFWGFKLDECGAQGGFFLLPHVDNVSYPFDWMDPFCTITFRSSTKPELGAWLVKGGDGKSGLYDAGYVWVPSCMPAVSAGSMTWGSIKVLYR